MQQLNLMVDISLKQMFGKNRIWDSITLESVQLNLLDSLRTSRGRGGKDLHKWSGETCHTPLIHSGIECIISLIQVHF